MLAGNFLIELDLAQSLDLAVDAIIQDRLALVCGAGLSMAPPSAIPSAAAVANSAKEKYDAIYGADRPPLSENIEEQAEFFFGSNDLVKMYLRQLVSPHTFSSEPNRGHFAVADFLLTSAARIAVSTNVDSLIEQAGDVLQGNVAMGVDRDSVAAVCPAQSPLLKIHGCWKSGISETVWAPSQLSVEPLKTRIALCAAWLQTQLLDRDLVIVGYFTDWDYLNSVLKECLDAVSPSNIIVVDPSTTQALQGKAPALFELGANCTGNFVHVRSSGDEFLNEMRRIWSISIFRRILHSGYRALIDSGVDPDDENLKQPPQIDDASLWRLRRDLEGVEPSSPCVEKAPPNEPLLGVAHIMLRNAGAHMEGNYWVLGNKRVRVLRANSQGVLHEVEEKRRNELSPLERPDVTIAVGATDLNLHSNIARSDSSDSFVRPSSGAFLTLEKAKEELNL